MRRVEFHCILLFFGGGNLKNPCPGSPAALTGEERCAGPALQAVLRYLAGRTQSGACRVMLFLAGPPNAQIGSVVQVAATDEQEIKKHATTVTDFLDPSFPELSAWQVLPSMQHDKVAAAASPTVAQKTSIAVDLQHAALPGSSAADLQVDWQAADFWEQAGSAAAALGIQGKQWPVLTMIGESSACVDLSMLFAVDIWAACEGFVGLELLRPVCSRSGGAMVLYPSVREASLPQARLLFPLACVALLVSFFGMQSLYASKLVSGHQPVLLAGCVQGTQLTVSHQVPATHADLSRTAGTALPPSQPCCA